MNYEKDRKNGDGTTLQVVDDRRRRVVVAAFAAVVATVAAAITTQMASFFMSRRARLEEADYEFLPVQTHQFVWLERHGNKFKKLCRLTLEETEKALALMGFPFPRQQHGRWKYSPLHRFMVFLMCLADSTRFERLSHGQRPKPAVFPSFARV
jgi:hypothetical protein